MTEPLQVRQYLLSVLLLPLALVDLGGGITLGVGRDDGVLRIWLAP